MSYQICLDPGHQSIPNADTGCSGFGLHEEDVVVDICKRAKPLLEFNGIKVIMTRESATVNGDGSSLVASLNTRCQIANNSGADLFLSVHCDAFNGQAYGTSAHIYGAGGKAEQFAKIINLKMGELFYNRGIKVSNFQVLRDTNMSAVLLETAFLDNANDNAKLADENIRQEIANIITKSACEYFGIQYKEQQGGQYKVKNLVLTSHGVDERAAGYLADHLNCSIAFRDAISTSDLDQYENVHEIGGSKVYSRSNYISGSDRYDTCQKVLDWIKTH